MIQGPSLRLETVVRGGVRVSRVRNHREMMENEDQEKGICVRNTKMVVKCQRSRFNRSGGNLWNLSDEDGAQGEEVRRKGRRGCGCLESRGEERCGLSPVTNEVLTSLFLS